MTKNITNKVRNTIWSEVNRLFTHTYKTKRAFWREDEEETIEIFISTSNEDYVGLSIIKYDNHLDVISKITINAENLHDVNQFLQMVKELN